MLMVIPSKSTEVFPLWYLSSTRYASLCFSGMEFIESCTSFSSNFVFYRAWTSNHRRQESKNAPSMLIQFAGLSVGSIISSQYSTWSASSQIFSALHIILDILQLQNYFFKCGSTIWIFMPAFSYKPVKRKYKSNHLVYFCSVD